MTSNAILSLLQFLIHPCIMQTYSIRCLPKANKVTVFKNSQRFKATPHKGNI